MNWRDWLALGRISNLPTVWSNVLAGWWLGGGNPAGDARLAALLVGGSLVYTGGCTLNDAFDAAWDRKHRPERPIPAGRLSERAVWIGGGAQLLAGATLMAATGKSPAFFILCLLVAIVFYDWIHKKTAWAVIPMGLCRFFLLVAAGAAAGGLEEPVVWAAATGVLAYIAGVSLMARREATTGRPNWAAVPLLWAPVAMPWLMQPAHASGMSAAAVAIFAAAVAWLSRAHAILRRSRMPDRIGRAVAWWLAGLTVLDAWWLGVMVRPWWLALVALAMAPVALVLQRRFAAT